MTSEDNREWLRLTRERYRSMQRRFARRKLDFKVDDYRRFLLDLYQGDWHGTVKCAYFEFSKLPGFPCHGSLHIYDLQLDHKFPPGRGGSLGLDNLVACCKPCNCAKGQMSHVAFIGLLECAARIPIPDRKDLLDRLSKSTQFIFGRAHSRKKPRSESIRLSPILRIR